MVESGLKIIGRPGCVPLVVLASGLQLTVSSGQFLHQSER